MIHFNDEAIPLKSCFRQTTYQQFYFLLFHVFIHMNSQFVIRKAILTLITGGQTGVDRAVLDAPIDYNIVNENSLHITGWCPNGRIAEDGLIPDKYSLHETPNSRYSERTEWNVRDSDATLILYVSNYDDGTKLTIKIAFEKGKPIKIVNIEDDIISITSQVIKWMSDNKISRLNVAGPRESNCNGIYYEAYKFTKELLKKLK